MENKERVKMVSMKRYGLVILSIFVFYVLRAQQYSYEKVLDKDFISLNRQAIREYSIPVRPGDNDGMPFWNKYAKSFMFAPVFEFVGKDKAKYYRYTVNDTIHFKADTPIASLSEIWNVLPIGNHTLVVEAFDKKNRLLGEIGRRDFIKKYPFKGPYNEAVRTYRETALKGLLFFSQQPFFNHWIKNQEPDMRHGYNSYACKIIGSTISIAVAIARYIPEYRENAIQIAKNSASFLIRLSQPEGAPLAYFPPTYYGDKMTAKRPENVGKTMMMEAVYVANAFLDMYDLLKDKSYLDRAVNIARTYLKLQQEDGSWPIKVDFCTAEPVNDAKSTPTELILLFDRLKNDYGFTEFVSSREKAFDYVMNHTMKTYDWRGQFEDMTVFVQPYENMTNCTPSLFACLLLDKKNLSDVDTEKALELIRFCEDQFVLWGTPADGNGIVPIGIPCVFEQYDYQTPVDASACNMINAYIRAYNKTKDALYLAKAMSLTNNITVWQNTASGFLPTLWKIGQGKDLWMNCAYESIKTLFFMDNYLNKLVK